MVHSHLPVNHLIKQIEERPLHRDARSDSVTRFVEQVAELFEPLLEEGRVGFDCNAAEDRWEIGMFLGSTEVVGGHSDGELRRTDFAFDVGALLDLFDTVARFRWHVIGHADKTPTSADSSLLIEGRVGDDRIRLQLYASPPVSVAPAFRELQDGTRETI